MPNAAMIAVPRFIQLKSKARMDNQSTESEAVMEYPRRCGQKRPSDLGLFQKPNSAHSAELTIERFTLTGTGVLGFKLTYHALGAEAVGVIPSEWWTIRTLFRFSSSVRIAGDSPGTPKFTSPALDSYLGLA
jgi:hypothetical protein